MALFAVFNPKFIYNEDEHDGPPLIPPHARCGGHLEVPEHAKVVGEEVISQFAGLFEAVDSLGGFEVVVEPAILDIDMQVVFVDEFDWYVGAFDANIFWMIKWCAKVEILDVKGKFSMQL